MGPRPLGDVVAAVAHTVTGLYPLEADDTGAQGLDRLDNGQQGNVGYGRVPTTGTTGVHNPVPWADRPFIWPARPV